MLRAARRISVPPDSILPVNGPMCRPMNTPTENDESSTPPNGGGPDNGPNNNGPNKSGLEKENDSGKEQSPREEGAGPGAKEVASGAGGLAAEREVTSREWRRLRAPFSREAYVVGSRATGRTAANLPLGAYSEESQPNESQSGSGGGSPNETRNQAVVDLWLRAEAIRDRLDLVLGPGRYGYRLEAGPEAGGTFSMRCHLRIGPGRRTGIGTGRSLQQAGKVALASAAEAFGMGASGKIAGPLVADSESWHQLPGPVLERLERREELSSWAPGSSGSEDKGQA